MMSAERASRGWRYWARRLLPPLVVEAVRAEAVRPPRVLVWRGVYGSLREVPVPDGVGTTEPLVDLLSAARKAIERQRAGEPLRLWHDVFVTVCGIVAADRGRLSVVDFGGGAGTGFIQLRGAIPSQVAIGYEVIDLPDVCAAGRQLFADDGRVTFSTQRPIDAPPPDVVYANSVVQYVDDYRGTLRTLAGLGAEYLLLSRTAIWPGARFATQQVNLEGHVLPHWFLNEREVFELLRDLGYAPVIDLLRPPHPVDLPPSHHVDRLRDVLFRRARVPSR